jgi:2',3'-cyclic-nucleotide 2'-phosphodiesterase (5'-nucleotidase family)
VDSRRGGGHRVGVVGVAHPETGDLNPEAAAVRFTDPVSAVQNGIDGTLVCRPGAIGRYLLEVSFDGRPTATHHDVSGAPIHEDVVETLRGRMIESSVDDVVGTTDEPVYCDMMACKRGESRIGNVVTDAYRWQTGVDVAVNSGGGFRRRPPLRGEVTAFDLVSITPYDSDLLVLAVDGNTVRALLRQLALEAVPDDVPRWHFGHVSGASIVWDDATAQLRSAHVAGEPVNPAGTYEVTTSEFFVDNDELFPAIGWDDVVERDGPQYEAVVEYVRETGLDPEPTGRIRRPELDPDAVPDREWPHSPE